MIKVPIVLFLAVTAMQTPGYDGRQIKTLIVIGTVNVVGNVVLIYPGKRFLNFFTDVKTPRADGTMSQSGRSNFLMFRKYMKKHFMKSVLDRADNKETNLVLYDDHNSHVLIDFIDWALEYIVLFVCTPHTSNILQPMEVFWPTTEYLQPRMYHFHKDEPLSFDQI